MVQFHAGVDRLSSDPSIEAVEAWVRTYARSLGTQRLSDLATGDLPIEVAAQQIGTTPEYKALMHTLGGDAALQALLAKAGDGGTPILYVPWYGIPLFVGLLPVGLLAAACLQLRLSGESLTEDAVVAASTNNLRAMRQIARGEPYAATVATAISGITLPGSARVHTAIGTVRGIDPDLTPYLLGRETREPSLIVTTSLPLHVPVLPPGVPPPDSYAAAMEDVRRLGVRICSAVLLAVDADQAARPVVNAHTVVAPFRGWQSSLSPAIIGASTTVADHELSTAEAEQLQRLCEPIGSGAARPVELALERTLLAATQRILPPDVLVDAVTAWENMVGTDSETTFRVTAALAWLMEDASYPQREALYRELRKIYDVRSKVVHGEEKASETVAAAASRALTVSRLALVRLLTERPSLLSFKKSSERADAILLGRPD